ncbi:hypothetical protein ACHAWF_009740 [Thalassiosira exigua]
MAPTNSHIKEESLDGIYDDETEDEVVCPEQQISDANLVELPSEQTSKLNFPIGCPIWYDVQRKSRSLISIRNGTVIAVAMDVLSRKFFYRVEKVRNIEDLSGAADSLSGIDLVPEDKIVFAAKCQVLVRIDGDAKEAEGEIVCPRMVKGDDGMIQVKYSIMYFQADNILDIEDSVLPNRIKYNYAKLSLVSVEQHGASTSQLPG